jgi:hypothetical protein
MVRVFRMCFQPLIWPVRFSRFGCAGGDEVEDLHRGLLVREVAAVTDRPPEPRVQRLDRVGGVDDLAELGGNSRNGTNSPQEFSHDRIIAGYLSRHCSANSANATSAASTVGAS